ASVSPPPPPVLPPQARATIPAAAATARTLSRIGFINPPFRRLFETSLTWLPSLFVLGDNTYLVSACPPGGGHPAIEPWPESAGAGKVWQVPGQNAKTSMGVPRRTVSRWVPRLLFRSRAPARAPRLRSRSTRRRHGEDEA